MGATQKRIPVKTAPATAGSESRLLNAPIGSILCSLSYITTDDLERFLLILNRWGIPTVAIL